ncbi:MAG: IMP dehydrogenase, partial [Defluviitaleaceae bacterium]|nr:IMP dehydrogenase [Defluviitaleaceae bacterium]
MAFYYENESRTFNEYLLVPGYSSAECISANVSLKAPLVKHLRGQQPAISLNIPLVSAIMQSVSDDTMAIALAKEGGISFIYQSQSVEAQAAMVSRVKNHKAGFVSSAVNIRPDQTLGDVLALKEQTGYSTVAVTEDGTLKSRFIGLVTSKDYRVSRMDRSTLVSDFMVPFDKLIYAEEGATLSQCNDLIWNHKLNALPVIDKKQRLAAFVFRRDYDMHKDNLLELLDADKRYVVGAGINTHDYEERVPALVEAGADV